MPLSDGKIAPGLQTGLVKLRTTQLLDKSPMTLSTDEDSRSESHQIEWLYTLAERAAREFGFTSPVLKILQHLVNTTFQLTANGSRFLLRVHREGRSVAEVESELLWLESLYQSGLDVQKPHRAPG